jgi:Ca2+-binding EF-hand superfamily protein
MDDVPFSSKLKDALKSPFELLADADTGCISKKSALAHLLLCKAKQVSLARDNEQIKMLVDLIFQEADLNEDGKISLEEAFEAVSRVVSNGFPAEIEAISKEEQESLLKTIENYTEQLSLDSKTSGADRLKQIKNIARSVFSSLDRDKSGFLEKEEVFKAYEQFMQVKLDMTETQPPPSEIKRLGLDLISMADVNGDGKLSFDEFFRAGIDKLVTVITSQRCACRHIAEDSDAYFEMPDGRVSKDENAEAWLGAMPVVLFTQFKLVAEGYGRDMRGPAAAAIAAGATEGGRLDELVRSLPFSSRALMESTLATLEREGLSLAALATTTNEEFADIGVPEEAREVLRIGLLKSLAANP